MGMPLANAAPAMTLQPRQNAGGVSLMPFPATPLPQQSSPMAGAGGQGMGLLAAALQKQMADQNRGGPVPGIALPPDVMTAIGSQINTASFPPPAALDMTTGSMPSITGEMVPAGAGSQFDLSNLLRGIRGWWGGFGG